MESTFIVSSGRSSLRYDVLLHYKYQSAARPLFQIFTQSIDAIDVTRVTLSRLNSINASDVKCLMSMRLNLFVGAYLRSFSCNLFNLCELKRSETSLCCLKKNTLSLEIKKRYSTSHFCFLPVFHCRFSLGPLLAWPCDDRVKIYINCKIGQNNGYIGNAQMEGALFSKVLPLKKIIKNI